MRLFTRGSNSEKRRTSRYRRCRQQARGDFRGGCAPRPNESARFFLRCLWLSHLHPPPLPSWHRLIIRAPPPFLRPLPLESFLFSFCEIGQTFETFWQFEKKGPVVHFCEMIAWAIQARVVTLVLRAMPKRLHGTTQDDTYIASYRTLALLSNHYTNCVQTTLEP